MNKEKRNKQGTLVVSLDFELFWGVQDCNTLNEYQSNVLGGRKAIPQMLKIFAKHGIHATWATVGFLMSKNYEELRKYFPEQKLRPTYKNSKLSSYRCFGKIGNDEKQAPCFYAPSLVEMIRQYDGQEIGCHTFSHYYCREEGQTTEQFEADVQSALKLAQDHGYQLTSFVFPRNQSTKEHIDVLRNLGFTSYRNEENDWIHNKIKIRPVLRLLRLLDVYFPLTGHGGYQPVVEDGIVDIWGSRMFKPYFRPLGFLESLKIKRIKKEMLYAAKNGLFFHLWWHPHNVGVRTKYHLNRLEEIFTYYDELKTKYGMRSLNMGETAKDLLSR